MQSRRRTPTTAPDSGSRPAGKRAASWWRRESKYRNRLLGDLALALPPTLVVLAAFFTTRMLTSHPILFASLASSAFLIYREPRHRMNRLRVMVTAQLLGWGIGVLSAFLFGAGYLSGAVAMTLTIILLIMFDIVHPPAVSTTLGFALLGQRYGAIDTFLIALFIVVALAVLQRVAIWTVSRIEQ